MSWPTSPLRDHRFEDRNRAVYCLEHGWMAEGNGRQIVLAWSRHQRLHQSTYGYLATRRWEDAEPENLHVALKLDKDLQPYVTFTTSSAWMNKGQVTEIRDFLNDCLEEMDRFDS